MADVNYSGILKGSDGSTLTISSATLSLPAASGPTGPTGPTGSSGPTGPTGATGATGSTMPNAVRIGAATYPLAAINPTNTDYPGGRGVDQLVVYRAPITLTITNIYGAEVQVSDSICGTTRDRLTSLDTIGTPIPSSGYVLSGHGTARDWLLANATAGARVELATVATTGPTGATGAVTTTAKTLAVYLMLWPGSGAMSYVPSQCNEVRLAFAQGSPPSLVGYGNDGQSALVSQLAAFRAKGGRVLISVGGAGGAVNLSQRNSFVTGFTAMRNALSGNVDGIDWDVEASSLNTADCLAISQALKTQYGTKFRVSFVPNGGNVSQYLPAAVACQKAGVLDSYGQQFYDSPVTVQAALDRIKQAITAGLPANKITVGMMVASDANHWTNTQCRDNYKQLKAAVPDLQGAYLWETKRAGTGQWASDLAPMVFN